VLFGGGAPKSTPPPIRGRGSWLTLRCNISSGKNCINSMSNKLREALDLAGIRFWTASILPTFVGTTLPYWLLPSGFTFRPLGAIEFLLATVLFHAGFSFLLVWFEEKIPPNWSKERILWSAGLCIGLSCTLGVHLNFTLQLKSHVYENIFLVYGFCAIFVGVLYVIPPINFYRQVGGEIIIAYSLGLLPFLGAYLVQAGDITRTVYLAALPVIIITGLWIWIDKLASYSLDEKSGRKSMVTTFGIRFSGQFGVLAISILYFLSLLLAVFSASVNPLVLVSLVLVVPMWKILNKTWNNYSVLEIMLDARKIAVISHFFACLIMVTSSLMIKITIPLPILRW